MKESIEGHARNLLFACKQQLQAHNNEVAHTNM